LNNVRFAAVHESGNGTTRTSQSRPSMSAFGGIADITHGRHSPNRF
jgi:hypothetical protein